MSQKNRQKELKKIIKKMRKIQKSIAAEQQPVSMHELDRLSALGEQYSRVVKALEADD